MCWVYMLLKDCRWERLIDERGGDQKLLGIGAGGCKLSGNQPPRGCGHQSREGFDKTNRCDLFNFSSRCGGNPEHE